MSTHHHEEPTIAWHHHDALSESDLVGDNTTSQVLVVRHGPGQNPTHTLNGDQGNGTQIIHVEAVGTSSVPPTSTPTIGKENDDTDPINPPPLSYWKLLLLFLGFGARAWGGPMAQISMVKEQLVIHEKWISIERFQRIFAFYQILPGPEAFEICCYFGVIARGKIGGIIAGLGFMLPGLCCMLLLSWIYLDYGVKNDYFNASFQGIQPAVAAMVARAVHKIGDDACRSGAKRKLDSWLIACVVISAIQSLMRINFLIINIFCALMYSFHRRGWYWAIVLESAIAILIYALVTAYVGALNASATATGVVQNVNPGTLFLLGLLGGCLSFGGAYTAVPFIQSEVTVRTLWMTNTQFVDGLALAAVLPAPMVIFATFVGYVVGAQLNWGHGGQFLGAILTTCGMFLPAFSFPTILHHPIQKAMDIVWLRAALDGVAASVVGLIAITSLSIIQSAVAKDHLPSNNGQSIAEANPLSVVIFICSLYVLINIKHRAVNIMLVIAGAIIGQVFYAPK